MRREQAASVITSGWGEGVALQLFAFHIYVVLFLVPLSPFLHSAAEASFDKKRLVGSRTARISSGGLSSGQIHPEEVCHVARIILSMRPESPKGSLS
jgi:hypothetical protein